MKKIADVIRRVLDRLNGHFIGPYVFSWLIYNWQVVLVLILADTDIAERIATAEGILDYSSGLVPVVIAFAFMTASPFISYVIGYARSYPIDWRKRITTEAERNDLQNQIENAGLQKKLLQMQYEAAIAPEFARKVYELREELTEVVRRLEMVEQLRGDELTMHEVSSDSSEAGDEDSVKSIADMKWLELINMAGPAKSLFHVAEIVDNATRFLRHKSIPNGHAFETFISALRSRAFEQGAETGDVNIIRMAKGLEDMFVEAKQQA